MDADLDTIQDALTEAQAENERLQLETADAEARIGEMTDELESARQQLLAEQARVSAEEADLRDAVTAFREAALGAERALPPGLVQGETIAEVRAAPEAARETVAGIRQRLAEESEPLTINVPRGTPPRRTTDGGALSPRDKITEGLRRSRA